MRQPLSGLAQLREILAMVLDRVARTGQAADYRLVGTSAALLQGVPLVAGDVDILVARRGDVDAIAAVLPPSACRAAPAWEPENRQYFARYALDGTDVEISTVEWPVSHDTAECTGAGPWRHYVSVACGTHDVPAVRLELRLVTELVRDRPDRAAALTAHMRAHGADLSLLQRAMTDQAVPPARQRLVLDALQRR